MFDACSTNGCFFGPAVPGADAAVEPAPSDQAARETKKETKKEPKVVQVLTLDPEEMER